jgi:hypothetical protein
LLQSVVKGFIFVVTRKGDKLEVGPGKKIGDGSGTDPGQVDYPDPSCFNLVLGQFGNRYVE